MHGIKYSLTLHEKYGTRVLGALDADYSTYPLERLNAEIKRRTRVAGIFPNDASITRLVGAMMLEQNDEWSLTGATCSLRACSPSAILFLLGSPQWLAE